MTFLEMLRGLAVTCQPSQPSENQQITQIGSADTAEQSIESRIISFLQASDRSSLGSVKDHLATQGVKMSYASLFGLMSGLINQGSVSCEMDAGFFVYSAK